MEAYEGRTPSNLAHQVVMGWIHSNGPALREDDKAEVLERVLQTAAEAGFREGLSLVELESAWKFASSRWNAMRADAHRRYSVKPASAGLADGAAGACCSAAANSTGATPNAGGPQFQVSLGSEAPRPFAVNDYIITTLYCTRTYEPAIDGLS